MNVRMRPGQKGLTMIEVLAILVGIAILVTLLLPQLAGSRRSPHTPCLVNVFSLNAAYQAWIVDHGSLPFRTNHEAGGQIHIQGYGYFDSTLRSNAWLQFLFLNQYLQNPRVLLCPVDKKRNWGRKLATSWGNVEEGLAAPGMQNNCVSYCIGLDAGLNTGGSLDTASATNQVLLTERHLEYDTVNSACSANVGLTKVIKLNRQSGTNALPPLGWKEKKPKVHEKYGMVAFLDGNVEYLSSEKLQQLLKQPGDNGELHFIYP